MRSSTTRPLGFLAAIWCLALTSCTDASKQRSVPILYSTDLFLPPDDPDDHFDLAALFTIDRFEILGIVLDQGKKQEEKPGVSAIRQLEALTGRRVPSAIGLGDPLAAPSDRALDQAEPYQGGVGLILDTLRASRTPVTIIVVGSLRDVAAAFNREPALFESRVKRLLIFAGEASDPHFTEYNVGLDPHAFVRIMESDLPILWVPCFDGGLWKNDGHASYWAGPHRELLQGLSPGLFNYFAYALTRNTSDPIAYLARPVDAKRVKALLRHLPHARQLWAASVILELAEEEDGEHPGAGTALFDFSTVVVSLNEHGHVQSAAEGEGRKILRFQRRVPMREYQKAMTDILARALRSL